MGEQTKESRSWSRQEIVVLAGLTVSLLLYYLAPPIPVWALGAALFLALAWLRLDLALLTAVIAAPLYRFPKVIDPQAMPGLEQLLGRSEPLQISLFEFVILACMVGWLLQLIVSPLASPTRARLAVRGGWWLSPPFAFLAASTLSLLASQFLHFSLREYRLVILEPLLFYLLLRQTVHSPAGIQRMLDTVLALGLGMAAFSLGHYLFVRVTEATGGVERVLAIYHSPNALALSVGRLLPVAAALLLAPRVGQQRRLLALSATALLATTFLLTYSRAGWLAALLALTYLGWLLGGRIRLGALGLAVAIPLLVAALVPPERLRGEASIQQRWWVWGAAVRMIQDHPLLGVGLDNFLYHYPTYRTPEAWAEPDISHPHNLVLDLWLRTGLPGLAAFAWLQISFWRGARLALRAPRGPPWAGAAGLAASMAYSLLHGLLDNSFFLVDLALLFWLTYGLMQAISQAAVPHSAA